MAVKKLARALLAAGSLVICALSQSAAAAPYVGSLATGLAANLSVLSIPIVQIGPIALASGLGQTPFTDTESVLSTAFSGGLLGGFGSLATGLVINSASGLYNPLMTGTASSTVSALNIGLGLPVLGSLLNISADTIGSTTGSTDFGGIAFTGTSAIENLTVSGLAVGGTFNPIIDGTIDQVLFNAGGLLIVANYQSPLYYGSTITGLQTSALGIQFTDFAFGTGLLDGTIVVGDSAASLIELPDIAPTVPEPATWATMLMGLGLIGAATRQRRSLAMA